MSSGHTLPRRSPLKGSGRQMSGMLERRHFLALGIGVLAAFKAPSMSARAGQVHEPGIRGRLAPDLEVGYWIDRDGAHTRFSMDELRGKWVYLKFFQNWCPGCHAHGFPALKQVADRYANDDRVAVLAVQTVFEGFGSNTQESVRELQMRYQLPIKMGHDPGDPGGDHLPATMRRYRSGGTPWVVIIDPAGFVVFNDFHVDPDKLIAFLDAQLAEASRSPHRIPP